MPPLRDASTTRQLALAAQLYLAQGYSVIPVYGDADPERPKQASVAWAVYQQRRATPQETERWFSDGRAAALAIVTGRISRLAVLDFDDLHLATEFAQRFPSLAATRIVLSAGRRLPHYYYHLPAEALAMPSYHAAGFDWQANGAYVLGVPSHIDGQSYTLHSGAEPRLLSVTDIQQIQQFLHQATEQTVTAPKAQKPDSAKTAISVSQDEAPIDSAIYIQSIYDKHRPQGRNRALFYAACAARDRGCSASLTQAILTQAHISAPAPEGHPRERTSHRLAELRRTVASAFKRPARPPRPQSVPCGLPTSLREAMLQRGQAYLVRVLDALLLAGHVEGVALSEKAMLAAVGQVVGRYSLRLALTAQDPQGQAIWPLVSPVPPSTTYVAKNQDAASHQAKKCFLSAQTTSDKKRGRPARLFHLPSIQALCVAYGVPLTRSDALQAEDLRSPRRLREALHRELIKRRPGLYSRAWLAQRLGVSRRSAQRLRGGVQSAPSYRRLPLTWATLGHIPSPDHCPPDAHLQDGQGKRYPARLEIAQRLLRRGQPVDYVRQGVNVYWHPETLPQMQEPPQNAPQTPHKALEAKPIPVPSVGEVNATKIVPSALQAVLAPQAHAVSASQWVVTFGVALNWQAKTTPTDAPKPKAINYHRPLRDARLEAQAHATRAAIAQLSIQRARQWLSAYGESLVKEALSVLQCRTQIRNAAGFVAAYLSSTHRQRLRSSPTIS